MNCRNIQRIKYAFQDGALSEIQTRSVEAHLKICLSCGEAYRESLALNKMLRVGQPVIEPSPGFEARFWARVRERETEGWLAKLDRFLADILPVPQLAPVAAFLLAAFLIGSAGGFVSFIDLANDAYRETVQVIPLSGFQEYKGVPSSSLTGTYLRAIEGEDTK